MELPDPNDTALRTDSQAPGPETRYRIHRGGLPSKILDLLDIDPGWWTSAAVHHRFPGYQRESVARALQRLDRAGLLESRPRILNEHYSNRGGQPEFEYTLADDTVAV